MLNESAVHLCSRLKVSDIRKTYGIVVPMSHFVLNISVIHTKLTPKTFYLARLGVTRQKHPQQCEN